MKCKLYPNMKRLTTGFTIGILCITVSVLALRLTVFSDMAAAPEGVAENYSSEEGVYQINRKIYFSSAKSKGDLYLKNLSDEHLIRVNITLTETGRSILSTGWVNPGGEIKSRAMDAEAHTLEDGVYQCIATISAYEADDRKTPVGSAKTEIEVYIGEKPDKKS